MRNALLLTVAVASPALVVLAQSTIPCFREKWSGCTCTGECETVNTRCPTKVVCWGDFDTGYNKHGIGIPAHAYACEEWYGDSGHCNTTTCCEGGEFIRYSGTNVTINYQPCTGGGCVRSGGGGT
ncbi:MAG: hypothetical protein HRU70_04625 [Phycisphaeraceae bacterium]|nr:MAG: hypothetical protein HRU70_04625 [Phycisphaeraceae bacterium]